MLVTTHESLARRICRDVGPRLPAQSLIAGARAPAHERRWPRPHHKNARVQNAIITCTKQARQEYMANRRHEAAFQLGVVSHFALDIMVPHRAPSKAHAVCESRFAQVDRNLRYRRERHTGLADGRHAERAIALLFRASRETPVDFEHRLEAAYLCMQRLAAAVTEEAEPIQIVNQSTEAFVRLATDLEMQLARYRALVEQAFDTRLHGSWDWEALTGDDGWLDRLSREVVGVNELLRAQDEVPALHTAALNQLCLWRFRHRLLRELAELLRWQRGSRHLRGRCQSIKRQYDRAAAVIEHRANHWNWFNAEWDFWQEKGGLGVKYIMMQATRTRTRPVTAEQEDYRDKCVRCLPARWRGTRRDRLGALLTGNTRLKVRLHTIPVLAFLALLAVLWGVDLLNLVQAGLIGAAGAGAHLLCARRTFRNLERLSACARTGEYEAEEPIGAGSPQADSVGDPV